MKLKPKCKANCQSADDKDGANENIESYTVDWQVFTGVEDREVDQKQQNNQTYSIHNATSPGLELKILGLNFDKVLALLGTEANGDKWAHEQNQPSWYQFLISKGLAVNIYSNKDCRNKQG